MGSAAGWPRATAGLACPGGLPAWSGRPGRMCQFDWPCGSLPGPPDLGRGQPSLSSARLLEPPEQRAPRQGRPWPRCDPVFQDPAQLIKFSYHRVEADTQNVTRATTADLGLNQILEEFRGLWAGEARGDLGPPSHGGRVVEAGSLVGFERGKAVVTEAVNDCRFPGVHGLRGLRHAVRHTGRVGRLAVFLQNGA